MKIKKLLIILSLCFLGCSLFAAPIDIWTNVGKDPQRTGQNLKAKDVDTGTIAPYWAYPLLNENSDYYIKTIDEAIVGSVWADSLNNTSTIIANPIRIRSEKNGVPHFMYTIGKDATEELSTCDFVFSGLAPGEEYQAFITVPSDLTLNVNEYNLASTAYVYIHYQNEAGVTQTVYCKADMSKEEYAGSWMYVTQNPVKVGPDGIITVSITNYGSYITPSDEINPYEGHPCIVMADAVRIVRMTNSKTTGSSVAAALTSDDIIYDFTNGNATNFKGLEYNNKYWKYTSKSGIFVLNSLHKNVFWGLVSQLNKTSDKIFVLAPDSNANPSESKFEYNFKVSATGKYTLYVDTVSFDSKFTEVDGVKYYNLKNYATQKYKVYCGSDCVGEVSIDMSRGGWQSLGDFNLVADTNCQIVLCPNALDSVGAADNNETGYANAPKAYVAGAVRITRSEDDKDRTPIIVSCFENPIKETQIGRYWTDLFVSQCGIKSIGNISAFNPIISETYWSYSDLNNVDNWDPLEGPVSNGFANSPILTYISDNGTKKLAAIVGDNDGIVYAFDMAAYGNTKLLFKGPGIFLSEPNEGVGTSVYKDWTKVSSNTSFGGSYLNTTNVDAEPIAFKITDLMREEAGDSQVYNPALGKQFSQWKWKVRFWVPPVVTLVGSQYSFQVKYYNFTSGDTAVDTKNVTINLSDLGTWKYIDNDISYYGVSEVLVYPINISNNTFIVDNIWLCPALPSGEELCFGENCDFTTDNEKYNANDLCENLNVSKLFAQTENGRLFAYDLTNINKDKIGKILWTYPKLDDRKFAISNSTPSFFGNKVYLNLRDLNSYNWNIMSVDSNYEFASLTREPYNLSNGDEQCFEYVDNSFYDLETRYNGMMNYLTTKTGLGYTYTVINDGSDSVLYKIVHYDEPNGAIKSTYNKAIGAEVGENIYIDTTPAMASYGNVNNPTNKVLVNDIYGRVFSFDITGSGTGDKISNDFISPERSNYYDHVTSNIITDGYIDSKTGEIAPRGYFGSTDGYLHIFDAVKGNTLRQLYAGKPTVADKRTIKATPILLDGLDIGQETLLNINGADGYNYTYSQHVYSDPKNQRRWKDRHAIAANWEALLNEENAEVIDPTEIDNDYSHVQVEALDWETANNLITIIKEKSTADSLHSRLVSDSYTTLKSIPGNTDAFITKNMLVIPKAKWNYIQTGNEASAGKDNKIDSEEKASRLKNYLLLEALKLRSNIKFDGTESGDPRPLFWKTNGSTGETKPREEGKKLSLEWGDHIYIAVWNMPNDINLSGTQAAVFEYAGNRDVPLTEKTIHQPTRRIPASVTTVYKFDPYKIKFENPLIAGEDNLTPVQINNKYLLRKLVILDCVLDCNNNKVQTMVGDGWTLCVDLIANGTKSTTLRYPITNLVKNEIVTEDPYFKDEAKTWIVEGTRRENFTINNPLAAKISNKTYGPTYKRFDSDNSYNGVKEADIVTVNLGDYNHNALTNLEEIAKVANRSELNINNFRVSTNNHTINSDNFLENYHPYPWEYGAGSGDYPYVSKNNVYVVDNDDDEISKLPKKLNAIKPWVNGSDAYYSSRGGNVDFSSEKALDIKYQVDIPRYQPAMNNYIANAYIYIDSNNNGKFDRSGTFDAPGVNCEPYRRFKVTFDVRPKPELYVEEDNLYFGEAGHGLGYPLGLGSYFTPYVNEKLGYSRSNSTEVAQYYPYVQKPEIMRWFKPFKVYNDGNVNLYDVSVNKQPLFANFANSNMSSFNEGTASSPNNYNMNANMLRIQENNVVSGLDNMLYSDLANDKIAVNVGAAYPISSNKANFTSNGGRTFTITKPRVGDLDSSPLTIPDSKKITGKIFSANNDYNRIRQTYGDIELSVKDAINPLISVTVPYGQPIGEYSTRHPITVNAKYGNEQNISSKNGINLNIDVTSSQITGLPYDKKTANASIFGVKSKDNNFTDFSDVALYAFKDDDEIKLMWNSERYANDNYNIFGDDVDIPKGIDVGKLYSANLMENYVYGFNKFNWWHHSYESFVEYEDIIPTGYKLPKYGNTNLYMVSYIYPYYYPYKDGDRLIYIGKSQLCKDNKILPGQYAYRIHYTLFEEKAKWYTLWNLDFRTEKKYPVMFIRDNKNWIFWETNDNGKTSISFTTDDIEGYSGAVSGFSEEAQVRMPSAISSAGKPNIIDRDPSDDKIELIYTGTNKITGNTDIYMSQYSISLNQENRKAFGLSEKAIPLGRVYDEMQRDGKYNFYVSKGLAWARQDMTGTIADKNLPAVVVGLGGEATDEKHEEYIDVFTGKVLDNFNKADWENGNYQNLPLFRNLAPAKGEFYPQFSFDDATGVMTIVYDPDSEAYHELGQTLVDFSSGVIRFTKLKGISETTLSEGDNKAGSALYKKPITVYASYVPQTISLTEGAGMNDSGFATYDSYYNKIVLMWRRTSSNTSNGLYYKIINAYNDNNGKLHYETVFSDKKIATDTTTINLNENSVSGFFDDKSKGNNDGKGYAKLWMFWTGTKSGKSSIYCETEAIDEKFFF